MIILPNHVYIHTPKTGGSSFEQMMWERHGFPVSGDQHNIAADIPTSDLHKKVFGFMRDPLISEVSNWRYHYFSWGSSKMTFTEWCEWRYGDKPEEYGYQLGLAKNQVEYGYKFNVRPSAGYFCDSTGNCVADRIYRYEDIGNALVEISEILGMDCSIDGFQAMQYNWSRGREEYGDHITKRAEDLISEAKAIDFEIWAESGDIPTDYTCPVVLRNAYSR